MSMSKDAGHGRRRGVAAAVVMARFAVMGSLAALYLSCATSPAFVGAALPSIIVGNDKKLAKNPGDRDLILETGRYYISYANAFVETPADMPPPEQHGQKTAEKQRAKELYLRGIAVLETAADAVALNDAVDFLYWKAAGTLAAFAIDPFDYSSGLGAKLPERIAMLNRAYELHPDYNNGALDEMLFRVYAALPAEMGGDKANTLAHKISQKKARWLLENAGQFFIETD